MRNHPGGDSRIKLHRASPPTGCPQYLRLPQQPSRSRQLAKGAARAGRLPAARAWEGGGALSQTRAQAPAEPLGCPRRARPAAPEASGCPRPALRSANSVPGGRPGPHGATGSQGQAGAPAAAAATSSLSGPVTRPAEPLSPRPAPAPAAPERRPEPGPSPARAVAPGPRGRGEEAHFTHCVPGCQPCPRRARGRQALACLGRELAGAPARAPGRPPPLPPQPPPL